MNPRLTAGQFDRMLENMLTRMGVNLAKDGHVSTITMGFPLPGGEPVSILVGPEDMEPGLIEAGPGRIPIYTVPGPYGENLDRIREIFTRHEVIAALSVGEAWQVSGAAAVEVFESGGHASEHPDRQESVLVVGYAPKLGYLRTVAIPMVRTSVSAGSALKKRSPTFLGTATDYETGQVRTEAVTLNWDAVRDKRVNLRNPADRPVTDTWLMDVLS